MLNQENIATRMKKFMEDKGYNINYCAQLLHVNYPTLGNCLTGKRKSSRLLLDKLNRFLEEAGY